MSVAGFIPERMDVLKTRVICTRLSQGALLPVVAVCRAAGMNHLPDSVGEEIGTQKSQ